MTVYHKKIFKILTNGRQHTHTQKVHFAKWLQKKFCKWSQTHEKKRKKTQILLKDSERNMNFEKNYKVKKKKKFHVIKM